MRKFVAGGAIVLVAAAYLAGYWPAQRRAADLQAQVDALRGQLSEAQARVRLADVLGHLLAVIDAIEAKNFGQAQQLASRFFDAVRAETARTPEARFKATLEAILGMRDRVTASLTRMDAEGLSLLRDAQSRLRDTLGYPRAPELSPPAPSGS